ncbi:MAG: membrane-spanning protein [Roseburia sp.]|nr:membrane-spanning protein [Roseburia sp.]
MNRNTYRICLIMLIAIAIFSTVLYYQVFGKKELHPKDGVFVFETCQEGYHV